MSVASCFWALLSLENFEFIYLPKFITDIKVGFGKNAGDILLHRSLLEFIHPQEISFAKTDLMNFIQIKTLAGAVTRCRLKSIKSIIYQENGKIDNMLEDWIITDVVMYTATKNTILTFFHSHEIENSDNTTTTLPISNCGSRQLDINDSNTLLDILKLHSLPMQQKDPIRIFEIYDTQTKQLIISCPSFLYDEETKLLLKSATELANTLTLKEMDKRIEQQLTSPLLKQGTACTYHSHSTLTAVLEPYGLCRVESIIITYGSLTFSTYHITPMIIEPTKSPQDKSYHHYMHYTSIVNNSIDTVKRKSNIKDILNDKPDYHIPPLLHKSTLLDIPEKYHYNITSTQYNTISTKVSNNNITKSPPPTRAWKGKFGAYEKKCENCQTNASPEWRRGPTGHKTLCNACGLRYARLVAKHERQQGPKEDEDRSNHQKFKTISKKL